MKADPNRYLRLLPLAAGAVGGILLLINRLSTDVLTPSQSRSDVVGVILSGLLVCIWLIWQQIQPRSPDEVTLVGEETFDLLDLLTDDVKTELAWASHLLLNNTVTQVVIIYYDGQILLRRGIRGAETTVTPGKILSRVLENQKPVYLVNLPLYPGRVEFNYLPENTQGLICQPIGQRGVMILGANIPRSYTRQDENWIAAIADKLAYTLQKSNPAELSS